MKKLLLLSAVIIPILSACLFGTDFEPLKLDSPTIEWHAVWWSSRDAVPNDANELMRGALEPVLENQKGWQRAGIDFHYTENFGDAQIVFYLDATKPFFVGPGVGEVVLQTSTSERCIISINSGYLKHPQAFAVIVNHETGHCLLGEKHSLQGVMQREASFDPTTGYVSINPYPSQKDIQRVRERLR